MIKVLRGGYDPEYKVECEHCYSELIYNESDEYDTGDRIMFRKSIFCPVCKTPIITMLYRYGENIDCISRIPYETD